MRDPEKWALSRDWFRRLVANQELTALHLVPLQELYCFMDLAIYFMERYESKFQMKFQKFPFGP